MKSIHPERSENSITDQACELPQTGNNQAKLLHVRNRLGSVERLLHSEQSDLPQVLLVLKTSAPTQRRHRRKTSIFVRNGMLLMTATHTARAESLPQSERSSG